MGEKSSNTVNINTGSGVISYPQKHRVRLSLHKKYVKACWHKWIYIRKSPIECFTELSLWSAEKLSLVYLDFYFFQTLSYIVYIVLRQHVLQIKILDGQPEMRYSYCFVLYYFKTNCLILFMLKDVFEITLIKQ